MNKYLILAILAVVLSIIFIVWFFWMKPQGSNTPMVIGGDTMDKANALLLEEKYEAASAIYQNFINSSDTEIKREALYGLGRASYQLRDYDKAIYYFETALELKEGTSGSKNSTLSGVYVYLSYIYTERGEYDRAIATLKRSMENNLLDLKDSYVGSSTYSLIGSNYVLSGDIDMARVYFEKSLKQTSITDEDIKWQIKAVSLGGLAECAYLSGNREKALEYLKEATALGGESDKHKREVYVDLSTVYLMLGQYNNVLDSNFSKKLLSFGNLEFKVRVLYNLGIANMKNGKIKEAENYFYQSLSTVHGIKPTSRMGLYVFNFYASLNHFSIAKVHSANENLDGAITELNKAIDLLNPSVASGFRERVDADYLSIASRLELIKILEKKGNKDLVAQEKSNLATFVAQLSLKEKNALQNKQIGYYIDEDISASIK